MSFLHLNQSIYPVPPLHFQWTDLGEANEQLRLPRKLRNTVTAHKCFPRELGTAWSTGETTDKDMPLKME